MKNSTPVVLVVDDEPQIRRFLRNSLTVHGFEMAEAANGAEALRLAPIVRPSLVVLDLGLPDLEGFDVLKRLREWSDVPIIILSVRSHEAEKVKALELGADDYVTKPFGMAEFLARVRAALRRHQPGETPPPVFAVGDLQVDQIHRRVLLGGADVRLSPKQYNLLTILVRHAGKVVTHHQLLNEIWGPAHTGDIQYLRVFVRKLRNKIEADPAQPRYLLTELGVGYRLRAPE